VEGLGPHLAKGCHCFAALTLCKQKHPLKLSAITSTENIWFRFDKGSDPETITSRPSYAQVTSKLNEEAVVVKLAVA
jgi:hypothetical protein